MSENGRAPRSVSAVWDSGGTLMCTVHEDSLMPMPQLHFTKVNAAPNALWPFALRGFQRSGASPETAAYCTECRAVLRIRAPQQVLRPAPPVRRTVLTSTGAPLTHVPVRGRELVPSGVALRTYAASVARIDEWSNAERAGRPVVHGAVDACMVPQTRRGCLSWVGRPATRRGRRARRADCRGTRISLHARPVPASVVSAEISPARWQPL